MKKAVRILALALSAVMICSTATACTSENSSSKSAVSTTSSSVSTKSGEMRNISSMNLVKEMKLCWNLGNSLDVCNADRDGDGNVDENSKDVDETLWGNVKTTEKIFTTLKSEGFNAVRIPITWRDHIDDKYTIDSKWMDRVQEVVDYAYKQGLYVIINVHHDGGGDPDFGAWIRKEASEDYNKWYTEYSTIWKQISKRFENYSDKLIFESMNEVGFDDLGTNAGYELLNKMNQAFVDLIRKQGGNNPERHLLIAGYWTDVEKTCSNLFKMPTDAKNRCILSVHYYTPWEFCTCTNQHDWGTSNELQTMKEKVAQLKSTFIDKNIPVIVGEYGTAKGNDDASRIYFSENLTKMCYDIGVPCFFWDDGSEFDRTNYKWTTSGMLEALQRAVTGKSYTVTKSVSSEK